MSDTGVRHLVTGIEQVAVVVHDLEATVKAYVETAGIGPWAIYDYEPPVLTNTRIRGRDAHYSMRLALAWTKGFMWEIIQPLEGPSIYREFLDQHGEGVHHVCVEYGERQFEEALAEFERRGCPPLMEGHYKGSTFVYVAAEGPLKTVVEIVKRPKYPGYKRPDPARWYPAPPPVSPL
jgi:hypothetical protein